jgi:hypothetical protein
MTYHRWNRLVLLLALGFIVVSMVGGCAATQTKPQAILQAVPDKVAITPDLMKNPITFTGSGFGPKEIIVIEMVLPKGVKVKGVPEGENAAMGNGNADDKGAINIKMGAMTTMNTLFQVEWTPLITPDFKKASPLPPGDYEIVATGMETGRIGKTKLTILPPPPPAEKK